jgi:hypothetical protein
MKYPPSPYLLLCLIFGLLAGSTARVKAQGPLISARDAVTVISTQFGPRSTLWIAELKGLNGVPQPSDWQIVSYDDRSPKLLYRFWASAGRAVDGGPDDELYFTKIPNGYFSLNQIGVDSVAAFTIAEGEARKAKMAFDSCDYHLSVREYTTEPIWELSLLDAAQLLVGKIFLSATNGQVMRTVWVYRDQRARPDGRPLILDSYAPTGGNSLTSATGGYDTGAPVPPTAAGSPLAPAPAPAYGSGVAAEGSMAGTSLAPVPAAPAPYQPVPAASAPVSVTPPASVPAPYKPVAPAGSPYSTGIPDPPAVAGGASAMSAPAPAPAPVKPPIDTSKPSAGSSDRIPPPPIPQ